jgi:O-antigen/teichoic acid export membrane protein
LNTILIAADDEEAKISMLLNRFINIILSLICCLFVIFIFFITPNLLNFSEFGLYVFLLPISIFLNGQNEIFRVFANRKKEYNLILTNTILISVISPLISIPTGLLVNGPFGLFFSLIIGQITAYFFLSFRLKRTYNLKLSFKKFNLLVAYAKKHIDFPKYILPSYFMGRMAKQLPVFMINRFFGLEILGVYNLATRMLGLPSQLLTNSISEVFRQRLSEEIIKTNQAVQLFKKTFTSLALILTLPLFIILLFGPQLFTLFFGQNWVAAGQMSQILIWYYSFQMAISPLAFIFTIRKKLQEELYIHIYLIFSCLLIFYFSSVIFKLDLNSILVIYVINYCLVYVYYFVRSFQLVKVPIIK